MSNECVGINYALRFRQKTLEIRTRPFRNKTLTLEISRIKSIELQRKSVMPPAMIGAVCLASGLVIGIAQEELAAIVPLAFQILLQLLVLGMAAVCLIILVMRWFLSSLILKPIDGSAITVRMVPTNSARRFVMLIHQTPPSK